MRGYQEDCYLDILMALAEEAITKTIAKSQIAGLAHTWWVKNSKARQAGGLL